MSTQFYIAQPAGQSSPISNGSPHILTVEEVLERRRRASTQPNTPIHQQRQYDGEANDRNQYDGAHQYTPSHSYGPPGGQGSSYSPPQQDDDHGVEKKRFHSISMPGAERGKSTEEIERNEDNRQANEDFLNGDRIYSGIFHRTVGWFIEGPIIDALKLIAKSQRESGNYTVTREQFGQVGNLGAACSKFSKRMIAEAIGTAFLTFACATYGVSQTLGNINLTGNAIASGFTLTALIYSLGDVSGCHINPAVTLTFAARRAFPLRWMLLYWASQLCGACIAGAAILGFYGNVIGDYGVNGALPPQKATGADQAVAVTYAGWTIMLFEAVVTSLLCFSLLSVSSKASLVGMHAALAGGFALAAGAMASGGYSSFSMNPARSLGPCLVLNHCDAIWPYVAGPLIGACFATMGLFALKTTGTDEEMAHNTAGV